MIFFASLLFASIPGTEIASCNANEFAILNRQTYAEIMPIYEKKTLIDRRLTELATANPASKGIRGIFDLNHNEKYLREQSGKLGDAIARIQDGYELKKAMLAMKPCPSSK